MNSFRILKVATCMNLSVKFALTYNLCVDDNKDIFLRITQNEGSGYFSSEWVKLENILSRIDAAGKKPLTSFLLTDGLLEGRSSNTAGFIWAVLLAEGLVERNLQNPRVYDACDPKPFLKLMEDLINSGTDIKISSNPDGATPSKSESKKQSTKKSSQ